MSLFYKVLLCWGRSKNKTCYSLHLLFQYLVFRSIYTNFATVKQDTRRHIALWLLLAVFVPMLVLSSVHIHEIGETTETECADCVHHSCHGHMTAASMWTHDCVLCQFLTLTMLTATMMAVTVYINVCKKNHILSSCCYHTICCGIIVTRGPPSF